MHPTITVDGIEIDVKMAQLIKRLWLRGYETYTSCQDYLGDNWAVIGFWNRDEAQDFVDLARLTKHSFRWDAWSDGGKQRFEVQFPSDDIPRICRCFGIKTTRAKDTQ